MQIINGPFAWIAYMQHAVRGCDPFKLQLRDAAPASGFACGTVAHMALYTCSDGGKYKLRPGPAPLGARRKPAGANCAPPESERG